MTTLAAVIGRGLLADRPAAGHAGHLYFATDTGETFRDNGATWDAYSAAGLSNPLTTRGDLIAAADGGIPGALAVGTDGQVLLADSGEDLGLRWADPDTGGGGLAYPLDAAQAAGTLDGSYGDDFSGASLTGRWTRHVVTSGEESYQYGPGATRMRIAWSSGAAARAYSQAFAGSAGTFACAVENWTSTNNMMVGPFIVDSSGNGAALVWYDNPDQIILARLAAWAYSTAIAQFNSGYQSGMADKGLKTWLRLRKASDTQYYAAFSLNGVTWSPEFGGATTAFTAAYAGFGRFNGTGAISVTDIDWFDKTA